MRLAHFKLMMSMSSLHILLYSLFCAESFEEFEGWASVLFGVVLENALHV